MKLQLTRPLVGFDIESTGTKIDKDRIIEIAFVKIFPDGTQQVTRLLINPEQPIPVEATKVHGITDEMVKDQRTFKQMAPLIIDIIEDCDLLTYSGNKFDIPLLNAEFERAGITFDFSDVDFVDVSELYREFNPRTLFAAVQQYCGYSIENAHSAEADTLATVDLLRGIMEAHREDLPITVPELSLRCNKGQKRLDLAGKFAYRWDGLVVFTFGKHKDEPINTNLSYLKWMQTAQDADGNYSFPLDTRKTIAKLLVHDAAPLKEAPPSAPTGYSGYYQNTGQLPDKR